MSCNIAMLSFHSLGATKVAPRCVWAFFYALMLLQYGGAQPRGMAVMASRLSVMKLSNGKWAPSFFCLQAKIIIIMNKTIKNQATGLEIVEINHKRFAVETTNGNLSVNLTQMAKPFGESKRPSKWLRYEESKTYLDALAKALNSPLADLLTVRKGSNMPGTWCHDYRIAMRFAQWLDPAFSIQVDTLLVKLLTKKAVVAEPVNGVWPIIKDGMVGYPRKELLTESGYSYRSGNVQRMKERYGSEHFFQIYRTACVSPKMAELIHRRGEVRQLELNFGG